MRPMLKAVVTMLSLVILAASLEVGALPAIADCSTTASAGTPVAIEGNVTGAGTPATAQVYLLAGNDSTFTDVDPATGQYRIETTATPGTDLEVFAVWVSNDNRGIPAVTFGGQGGTMMEVPQGSLFLASPVTMINGQPGTTVHQDLAIPGQRVAFDLGVFVDKKPTPGSTIILAYGGHNLSFMTDSDGTASLTASWYRGEDASVRAIYDGNPSKTYTVSPIGGGSASCDVDFETVTPTPVPTPIYVGITTTAAPTAISPTASPGTSATPGTARPTATPFPDSALTSLAVLAILVLLRRR